MQQHSDIISIVVHNIINCSFQIIVLFSLVVKTCAPFRLKWALVKHIFVDGTMTLFLVTVRSLAMVAVKATGIDLTVRLNVRQHVDHQQVQFNETSYK